MKYLPIIGVTAALICYADLAVAKTPAEIESIAKAVTVEIRLLKAESIGSGIIIERQGDMYTLITNRHVVCGKTRNCTTPPSAETYTLKLGDRQQYKVSAKSVKILGSNLDLAIVQFQSNRAYPVAQVADPGSLKVGDRVYTSGYPLAPPGFSFNAGLAIAVVNKRLTEDRGGYTVIYNAETQPGMSGGGVFSEAGRLVAVHGQGERYRENTQLETVISSGINTIRAEVGSKIGYNRGIPVRWVVQGLADRGIRLGNRQPVNLGQTAASSADEHFIAGFNKLVEPGTDVLAGKRLAISEFSQAIRINPSYTIAYFMRAITYSQLQEERLALADFDRAITLDPKRASAYYNRGVLKADKLNDTQGALADYDRAIALDPKDANAYINRGNLKANKLNDHQGALADYDRAIALDPKDAAAYINRGVLKVDKLNDQQGALADYDRAIALDPKFAAAYNNRGNLKQDKLNDFQGALSDFDRAIALDPKYTTAYTNRGVLKADKLNDPQGALADYDRAIALDPKFANAYGGRGYLKYTKLGDKSGGIADMRQAAKLARTQGNSSYLQLALQALQSWGVGE
jgi:tetratricopeptide (TPR) repeat protein